MSVVNTSRTDQCQQQREFGTNHPCLLEKNQNGFQQKLRFPGREPELC